MLSYLVEHPKGSLVFDTGLHTDMRVDPVARIGRLARYFASELAPDTAVHERTAALEVPPTWSCARTSTSTTAAATVCSATCPSSCSAAEWEAAHGARSRVGYVPADFDTGQDVRLRRR